MYILKCSLVATFVIACCHPCAYAEEAGEDLDTIHVSAADEATKVTERKVGETVKTSKVIAEQQASDTKDLVKYETGVSVVEAGRFGSSGFAIRGVDENRVAIQIDGLSQAETISSQGFKELFDGYGNFNNIRNNAEVETLKQVKIQKGADSITSGNGALGGSVQFETKDARDYLLDKDYHFAYKRGYSSANDQNLHTLTFAGKYKYFDVLAVRTQRKGHELENYDYDKYDGKIQGKRREKADPYRHQLDSTLLKLSFQPSEKHRFTAMADLYKNRTRGNDFSYSLKYSKYGLENDEVELRHTDDMVERKNYAFTYENYASNPLWDTMKLRYSHQKITTRASTGDYCDGNDKCEYIQNPLGLKYNDKNELVDAKGGLVTYKQETREITANGKTYNSSDPNYLTYFDTEVTNVPLRLSCNGVNCGLDSLQGFNPGGSPVNIPFEVVEYNGEKFAQTKPSEKSTLYSPYLILPSNKGYLQNLWTERDLKTNTDQVNLDLTKYVELWNTQNNLSYGALWSRSKKEMINRSGDTGFNVKWWALYPVDCKGMDRYNSLCHHQNTYSFLIPVETTTSSLYFKDDVRVNNYWGFDWGYRYDHIKHDPEYIPGKTPKIPDDMVTNLYVKEPSFNVNDYTSEDNSVKRTANANANIQALAKEKKFSASSYSLGLTLDPTDWIRWQFKYSKGFRAPTGDEVFFTFKHPDFSVLPNKALEAETAKTKELALTVHNHLGFVSTSLFRTDYDNFIDMEFKGRQEFNGGQLGYLIYQNVNRDSAKVTGIEVQSYLSFGQLWDKLDGFHASYKYTYQKGRIDGDRPMNAIQPRTGVFNLGYNHTKGKFGVDLYVTHVGAKKERDTYNMYYKEQGEKNSFVKWRSDKYTLLDAIAYIRPIENFTLQFGMYNITNRKYITWDSARSIKPFGTSNLIDRNTGLGINRFYSAGRNFKISGELSF